MLGLGTAPAALAQQFTNEAVSFSQQPLSSNTSPQSYAGKSNDAPYTSYTLLGNTSTAPPTAAPSLGNYDLTTASQLSFTGGSIVAYPPFNFSTFTFSGTLIKARVLYRVYLVGTAAANLPTYSRLELVNRGTFGSNQGSTLFDNTASVNLLSGLLGGGDYTVDVQFQIDSQDNATGKVTTTQDPSASYQATFNVKSPDVTPPGGTTTWQSTGTSAWFTPTNWSNGVPTSSSDAIIPENTQGTNIIFPVLNNRARNYSVRNLTLQGTTNSGRAQITVQSAVLHVYGNIDQLSGGLVGTGTDRPGVADTTMNSTLVLAGGNQFITGRLSVPDVIVAGTGTKSVANTMLPTNTLSFQPKDPGIGVIIQSASARINSDGSITYVFDTTGNSLINLSNTGIINPADGYGETTTSYIKGICSANGPLAAGQLQQFGNIGLEFRPNHDATLVTVQRIIGDPLIGPTTPSPGVTPVPIRRQYNIQGDDNSSAAASANSTNRVVFHYLPSAYELNTIQEDNLTMFRTNTGSAPFTPVYGTLDKGASTVTQDNLPTFSNYYLTLGDKTNPLPVTLVSFSATRSGSNAQLVWATASEKDNKGFEVQVSADGTTFRTLAFVASQASTSSAKLDYTYTDTEAGKTGTRYYRLHQIDLDGTDSYSPVRVVGFEGATTATEVSVYPNPITDSEAHLLVQTAEAGLAHLRITDLMGRTVLDQSLTLASGSTELPLTQLAQAKAGTYLAKLTLPSGQVKNLKVQKP